ncbi:VapA/VapB family virulence-associated protein [Xenorhabdus innexi]|uniref:Virulence associated protein VapA n=1 Tax=Xenorhabdus innexi TaxID=290109 RepID=A0A1N6MWB5_9GAMM|nr:VapA/VapB family virulence-associated protein [Xenorhabdus innexi]PHM30988.1 hypothetical protein Xinn_03173 [Xenorhabdus innexi]SIP73102.1 hypothetical protein XIS1_1730019 [Xenorhabdus innexi]
MSEEEKVKLKILEEFKKQTEGKWVPELIDKTVKDVTSLEVSSYSASATIESLIIRHSFQVSITGYDERFDGLTWGWATPGIGTSIGLVLTKDLDNLLSDTTTFWFYGTPSYLGLYFYSDDNFLGSFQGASLSLVGGTGHGSGQWH